MPSHTPQRVSRAGPNRPERRLRRLIVGGVLAIAGAMSLAACGGGGDDSGFENLIEAAVEAGSGAEVDDLNLGEGGGLSASIGDADIAFGGALGSRPDWLESEFVLPEDMEIVMAINDSSTGERAIRGQINDADVDSVLAQQRAMLQSAGYEQIGDTRFFVRDGRLPIELDVVAASDTVVAYSLTHSFEDEQTLRDVYAPFEGSGTLVATVDGEDYTIDGTCTLRSTSGQFLSSNDDAMTNAEFTLELREGEQNYVLASVGGMFEEQFRAWSLLQVDEAGNYPTVALNSEGFTLEGYMLDFQAVEASQAPATLRVSCDR